MDRKTKEIGDRLEKWTRQTPVSTGLTIAAWGFLTLAPLFLWLQVWDGAPISSGGAGVPAIPQVVSSSHPLASTFFLVGLGVSIWYVTRSMTFDDARTVLEAERHNSPQYYRLELAREESDRLRAALLRHGIDSETLERITSG